MIAVDVEATGIEPTLHSIVSIGALDMSNPTNRFYTECHVWEGAHIDDAALAINGMSREEVTDLVKPSEGDAVRAFLAWVNSIERPIEERTICGQNPSFDRSFLEHAAHRTHLNWNLAHRTIDTHSLCFMHMITHGVTVPNDAKHHHTALNLDAVLNYVGIPDEPEPHNALTGALCHAEVAHRLLYQRQLLPEFISYPIPFAH